MIHMYKAHLICISQDGYRAILGVAHSLFPFGTSSNSIKKGIYVMFVYAQLIFIDPPAPPTHAYALK